jgi:glycosyltransferase involved in cell wall biosynthesis
LADRGRAPHTIWEQMGLQPLPTLNVHIAPLTHPGLAGLWFRWRLSRWWSGSPGLILARDKRRLLAAVDRLGKGNHKVVLETHEIESQDQHPYSAEVEARCLSIADALVANCGGTLQAWRDAHAPSLPAHICHNASHIQHPAEAETEDHLLVLGTLRSFKGVDQMLEAMGTLPYPVKWVGAEESPDVPEHIQITGPVPHAQVDQLVARARVLVAPLGDNRFSHQLTSPLKLWDYLGSSRPIVTAETAATSEIMRISGAPMHRFSPDSIDEIRSAIHAAWNAPPRTPFQRSWPERAQELDAIFQEVCGA